MYKNYSIFIFLLICHVTNCFSQNEIYIDENMKETNSIEFSKKCTEQAFKCLKFQKDSMVMYKVLYKFGFGTIDIQEYKQIKNRISTSQNSLKSNDVILINYMDSLSDYGTLKRNYEDHIKVHDSLQKIESLGNRYEEITHTPFNLTIYKRRQKEMIRTSKKCIKKFEKKLPVKVRYVYNVGGDSVGDYEELNIVRDRDILKTKFFKINGQFNLLILKPDGEYFLSGSHISDKAVKKLIETEDWSRFKADWQATIETYKMNGTGIFEATNFYYHKNHCF